MQQIPSVQKASSASRSTGATAMKKSSSSSASSRSSAEKTHITNVTKYWTYNATEISIESGGPSMPSVLQPGGSNSTTVSAANSCSSFLADDSRSTPTASAEDTTSEDSRSEVKLPKNAVELIAWAITQCDTTTPTLSQIAGYIQTHVSTYRREEHSVMIKMVLHHLNKNNPAIFLPVMSPAGHMYHNPSLARWAINRQVVTVADDGSIVRRRHRSHAYGNRRSSSSSSSSFSSSSSSSSTSSSSFCASPFGTPGTPIPMLMSPPDGTPDNYYSPATLMYPPPLPLGQVSPALTAGPSMTMLGSSTPGTMPAMQTPPMGTGLYGVPLSSPGPVSTIPSAPPQGSVINQWSRS